MAEPVSVVPGKSDVVLAQQLRDEIRPALEKVAAIIDTYRQLGLNVNFSVGPDNFGRITVKDITVVKPL